MNPSPTQNPVHLRSPLVALTFLLAMAVTRSGHFGSAVTLPDASLAVFFLLGLFVASPRWLPAAMGLGAAVDTIAIAGGVSAYCVTPEYAFLIVTYGAMWFAGRVARNRIRTLAPPAGLATTAVAASVGTVAAFLISNGSFYAFSGLFPDLSMAGYADGVARYFPPYFAWTSLYVAIGLAVMAIVRSLGRRSRQAATAGSDLRG